MMRAMKKVRAGWIMALGAGCVVATFACGGQPKQADSPGTCPEGTVLRGGDCVPPETSHESSAQRESREEAALSQPKGGGQSVAPGEKTPYDKEAVEAELKRGARQVKANCGSASDEDGKVSGPWGKTT